MASLSYGYSYGNPYQRPGPESPQDLFIINKGSIYSMLSDKFSVFKSLIDRSVLYRELLNNMNLQLTVLVVPDSEIPENVKQNLAKLDRAEATTLLGYHVSETAVKWLDGHLIQMRQFSVLLARIGEMVILPGGESSQKIPLLSDANFFKNGVVYVIGQPIIQGA